MKKTLITAAPLAAFALAAASAFAQSPVAPAAASAQQALPAAPATPAIPAAPETPDVPAKLNKPGQTQSQANKPLSGLPDALPDNGASVSGSASMSMESDFASLDANSDGKLSRQEMQANSSMSAQFRSLDVNGDGNVSKGEFNASVKRNKK